MAELKRRTRWKRWAPDVGENRELEGGPVLFLDIAVDLTPEQISEAMAKLDELRDTDSLAEFRERAVQVYAAMLEPYVRVHGGPHTVDGQQLATLEDYLRLVTKASSGGVDQLRELMAAFTSFNSVTGPNELFLLRRSGGARSTDAQSNEKAASPTAGR